MFHLFPVTATRPWKRWRKCCLLWWLNSSEWQLISAHMHDLTIHLQSHGNQRFLCRVNSVIGIGVGAGAYILSLFAVSPSGTNVHFLTPLLWWFHSTTFACNNRRFSSRAACCTENESLPPSPQSASGFSSPLLKLPSPQMVNHLGDSLLFSYLTLVSALNSVGLK